MSREIRIQDLLIVVLLMLVCAYVFVVAADFRRTAGHFPRIIAGFTFVLLLIQAVVSAKALKNAASVQSDKGTGKRFLMVVAGTFIYAFAIELLGYYISTLLYLMATIVMFGYKKKITIVATSLGLVLFIHLLFAKVLLVRLPAGILF